MRPPAGAEEATPPRGTQPQAGRQSPGGRPHGRCLSTFSLSFIWELPLLIFKCYLILPRKTQQVQGSLVSHQKTDAPADPSPRTPPAAPACPPQGTGRTVDWPPHCRHKRAATKSGGTSPCMRTLVPVGALCENAASGVSPPHPDNCELPQGGGGLQGSAARASVVERDSAASVALICISPVSTKGALLALSAAHRAASWGRVMLETLARSFLDSGCQLNVLQVSSCTEFTLSLF